MTQISRGELKARLISYAQQIGFDSCRIAACAAPTYGTEFRAWLREGAHGEMNYMKRGEEKRCDPHKVLPGARSIVVLALNYFQGEQVQASEAAAKGKIARYAWADDYHEVVESKLDKIDTFLRDFGGQQKCYVDTGPILERDHAARAGIGWHGKNTMLIDERLGTWFFLAEILTTLELPPDQPVADRCGTLKGSIPLELRPLVGDRIFGCDDCLDACPWNRFAQVSHETAFAARHSTLGMSLREYLELTDAEFRAIFKNSPIKRIKRRGFLRNVCVALGNAGDVSDIPALKRALADEEPLIAEHAEWAIHQIRSRQGTSLRHSEQRSASCMEAVIN